MRLIAKNKRELIRIGMAEHRGSRFLDVRIWAWPSGGGEPVPTPKGVTVPLSSLAAFAAAVADEAEREARGEAA